MPALQVKSSPGSWGGLQRSTAGFSGRVVSVCQVDLVRCVNGYQEHHAGWSGRWGNDASQCQYCHTCKEADKGRSHLRFLRMCHAQFLKSTPSGGNVAPGNRLATARRIARRERPGLLAPGGSRRACATGRTLDAARPARLETTSAVRAGPRCAASPGSWPPEVLHVLVGPTCFRLAPPASA